VSRFWLTYCDPDERLIGVVILDSSSLLQASFRATVDGTAQEARLYDGHELDHNSAALVPPDAIGRMLSLEEAGKIIRQIEGGFPKRASLARSLRRRRSVRTRPGRR
jgi:hypothetical protein